MRRVPPELILAHTGPDGLPRFTTLSIGKTFFPCNLQSINQSTSNNAWRSPSNYRAPRLVILLFFPHVTGVDVKLITHIIPPTWGVSTLRLGGNPNSTWINRRLCQTYVYWQHLSSSNLVISGGVRSRKTKEGIAWERRHCNCGKSRTSYPHWPPTCKSEAVDQLRCLVGESAPHRQYLAHCWMVFLLGKTTADTEDGQKMISLVHQSSCSPNTNPPDTGGGSWIVRGSVNRFSSPIAAIVFVHREECPVQGTTGLHYGGRSQMKLFKSILQFYCVL